MLEILIISTDNKNYTLIIIVIFISIFIAFIVIIFNYIISYCTNYVFLFDFGSNKTLDTI